MIFLPEKKKYIPTESKPNPVDTMGYYEPGYGPDIKCPACGKEHLAGPALYLVWQAVSRCEGYLPPLRKAPDRHIEKKRARFSARIFCREYPAGF